MKYNIITASPLGWTRRIDIIQYGERQAQSCIFLEELFEAIETRVEKYKAELPNLFDYLKKIHRRQHKDLEKIIPIPIDRNRRSFYFDKLYSSFGISILELPKIIEENDLLSILSIQAISYLRGKDRYDLLKNFQSEDNKPFVNTWRSFYDDATINANEVESFIYQHFDNSDADQRLIETISVEDEIIHSIWRYKNVK